MPKQSQEQVLGIRNTLLTEELEESVDEAMNSLTMNTQWHQQRNVSRQSNDLYSFFWE